MENINELDLLLKKVDENDIVSFDIFDTLLLRNVLKPSDIFYLLEKKVKKEFDIDGFAQIRMDAEAKSRLPENGYETTIEKIYEEIKNIDLETKEKIKQLEFNLEYDFLVANPFMKKVFDYCVNNSKKIVCITDMYLPKDFLIKALNKNGYKDVEVYLSCDFMKQKRDGSLFVEVYNKTKFDKKKWLHIGDNIESDYNQPIAFGINAYHYKKIADRINLIENNESLENSIIKAVVNNQINNGLYTDKYSNKISSIFETNVLFSFWIFSNLDNSKIVYIDSNLNNTFQILKQFIKEKGKKIELKNLELFNKDDIIEDDITIVLVNADNQKLKELSQNKNIKMLFFEAVDCQRENVKSFNGSNENINNNDNLLNLIIDKLSIYYNYIWDVNNILGFSIEKNSKSKGSIKTKFFNLFKKHNQ